MQLRQPPKTIFVHVDRRTPPWILVTGRSYHRNGDLGCQGLGFKWNPNKNAWEKPWSLKDFEVLESWSEVAVSPEAREQAAISRQSRARRDAYYFERAGQPAKTRLEPQTPDQREARRKLIESNRLKRESEMRSKT